MIVRDGGPRLARCLASVAPLGGDLIVVDTGSSDSSRETVRLFGGRIIEQAWDDDFAKARNAYLAAAPSDWILSIDADEEIGFAPAVLARAMAAGRAAHLGEVRNHIRPDALSWSAAPDSVRREGDDRLFILSRTVKLAPNLPGLHYVYPVHESLIPSLQALGAPIGASGLVFDHWGYLDPKGNARRLARNLLLGRRKLEAHPRSFSARIELGKLCLEFGDLSAAAEHFMAATQSHPMAPLGRYYVALTWALDGGEVQAARYLDRARRSFPHDANLRRLARRLSRRAPALAASHPATFLAA